VKNRRAGKLHFYSVTGEVLSGGKAGFIRLLSDALKDDGTVGHDRLRLRRYIEYRRIPEVMKKTWFRASVLTLLLTALGLQVAHAWGDMEAVGIAFLRVLVVTTTAGIVLGATFQQRAWCHICPMGTLGRWVSKGKNALHVSESCKDCKLCERVCPMQLKPYEHKSGAMGHGDCLKCSTCVAACPINALQFDAELKKAA
jgi:polyferredoxin